ncbi:MAG: S8 family serine peptidase [Bacteroidetes bacterium]|jgi:hypothetical protein|nr:S8 family serine peptidase [Bacteroidota bacterium]
MYTCIPLLNTFAQQSQTHYYYIEEASNDILNPTNITTNQDESLSIEFSDEDLTAFFEDFTIFSYVREFGFSRFTSLHKYYLIGLDKINRENDLLLNTNIVSAEYAGTIEDIEGRPLNTPNDYYVDSVITGDWIPDGTFGPDGELIVPYLQNNIRGFEHLELINARRAWNITTGDPNVVIGVRDVAFNVIHPEVANKVVATYGNVNSSGNHGLSVAGVAAGDTNNGIGFSSIGYNSSLAFSTGASPFTSNPFGYAGASLFMAEDNSNIKVINISMGSAGSPITAQADAFKVIKDSLNVTVVVAAGNGLHTGNNITEYYWPGSYEHVIGVSSVGSYNKYGHLYDNGASVGWKDVHEQVIGVNGYNHQHNDSIDIVAPGYNVPAPRFSNWHIVGSGTSYASPIVAGTAALMYAVNPGITAERVKEILQETADDKIYDIPENAPYNGLLGAGRVNAYGAVLKAECEYNGNPVGLDLNMQNTKDHFGDEPDTVSDIIWESPDIWVRNTDDGFLYKESEELHFVDSNTPVYVYVRVTNDSCQPSTGTEQLELYWAKGGLNQTWPTVWNGSSNPVSAPNGSGQQFDIGNLVGIQNIPSIQTGKYEILEFEWFPENPDNYEDAGFDKPWMFCFLSRIVTPDDPMTFPEVANAATNARNNNNIAYKNETVINVSSNIKQGTIFAGNLGGETPLTSNIQFFTNDSINDAIWQEAEIYTTLDENLWNAWQDSGAQNQSVRVVNANERRLLLTGNDASLDEIAFGANEYGTLTMSVNFLVRVVEDFEGYDLFIQQTESNTDDVLGGFTYTFTRDNSRQEFIADNETELQNDNTRTIKAVDINEPAIYNWYDADGNLIYSGNELEVSTAVANEYKLEVIAESDGHKDYQTVETDDLRKIESISPNPAQSQVNIKYLIDEQDNAIIKLTHSSNGIFYNYILENTQDNIDIDLTNFTSGQYIVNLISGGQILDTQNLIIN